MIVYFYHLHTCTYRVWTLSSAICHTTPAAATMLKCTSTRKSTVAWVADCYINQTLIDGRNYYYHSNINLFLPALQLDRPVPLYKEDTEDFTHVYCRSCTIVIGNHNKPPLHLSSHDCIERIERLLCSFHPRTLHNTIHTQSAPYPHCFYIYQTTFTKQHSMFPLLYSDKMTTVHQQHVKWKRAVTVVLLPTHGPQFFGGPPATHSQTFWRNYLSYLNLLWHVK